MFPVEDFYFAKKFTHSLGKAFGQGVSVRAKIGMMNKSFAADFQYSSQFVEVGRDEVTAQMHERIETEHEVDRAIGNHRQRAAIVEVRAHMRLCGETPTTRFDTFTGGVNGPQFLTIIFEIMCPSPKAGRDFQDCCRWQTIPNARKDGTGPLRGRTTPWLRPFFTCIFPIVFR